MNHQSLTMKPLTMKPLTMKPLTMKPLTMKPITKKAGSTVRMLQGPAPCIRIEVIEYSVTPKARETGSGVKADSGGSSCSTVRMMHGSTACIGMEVMKYTVTPKAREIGSGMSEPETGSFCQGGIIYPAFEAPVTMLLLCAVFPVSHFKNLVSCSICLIDMFRCKSAVSKKRIFLKVGFRGSQRSAEQSTKVIVDDCFHTVLNKPVLENKVGASEEV